jgi:O-antigen biosynthesis protein
LKTTIGIHIGAEAAGLHATLDSLRAHTQQPYDLILLCDGPDEPTRAMLATLGEFQQCGTDEPQGAPACFNRLVRRESSDFYVLLENGALVGRDWLGRLIEGLQAHPRNGLAGPSTNRAWNAQAAFPKAGGTWEEIMDTGNEALRRFRATTRTLEPLYSLADFCYMVRREVIETVGLTDEGFGVGPCWEMDYNIRAARAGWRGVWVCGAYVHRAPPTERRRREEARWFEANKRRYQDKFCGARLRGEKSDYRPHCRGEACPNFAPLPLPVERRAPEAPDPVPARAETTIGRSALEVAGLPLVSCIMPTCDRLPFVQQAVRNFQRQNYPSLELIVVDDGTQSVEGLLSSDPRLRLIRLLAPRRNVGAKRNLACAAARGEFIVHWDDDDWYPTDRVALQIEPLVQKRAVISGTSMLYFMEAGTQQAWRYEYRGGRSWVAGSTLAYRKSWWEGHPFPEIQIGEDSRFVWAAPAGGVCDLRRPGLCVARIHAANTSRKSTGGSCWTSCPIQEIESLLGIEWAVFAGIGASAASAEEWPLVSCIMPTYNRRSFLPLALSAFLAQDYPRKELVVVDDGTDGVSDLLCGKDFVRYLRLPARTSIGRKRNLACEAASGRIVAHWDDDDWHGSGRLRHQVGPLLAGKADVTGLEDSFELDLSAGCFWRTKPALHQRMFVGNVHGGTLVYWKRFFDEGIRYPDGNLAEDAAFLRQVLKRGNRLAQLPNPGLFVYMRHGRNSWRYQPGHFIESSGWERVCAPASFTSDLLAAYTAAVTQGASTCLAGMRLS